MYPTPDFSALRAALLRDIANQLPDAATGSDSDFAIRANAVAAAIEGLYQHQQWIVRQILPDTADSDYLERWANLYGIYRKPAAFAAGSATFSAPTQGIFALGVEASSPDGVALVTTAAGGILTGGSLTLPVRAVVAGVSGNLAAGSGLTLGAAPAGVDATATVVGMTGGAAAESDAALLTRLLTRLRQPPHGGNAQDYVVWARAVVGVEQAYVYPLRRGLGTVDVVIEGVGGSVPSVQLLQDAQAALDGVRPVTADCLVIAATPVPVAVTATLVLSGTTLVLASASITAALTRYFAALKPGDSVVQTRIAALLADTVGVVDFTLLAPAANVPTVVNSATVQRAVLGAVSLI